MSISDAVRQTPFLLGQLLDWPASLYPDRPAVEWEGGTLSFRDLLEHVREQEEVLAGLGAGRFQRWGLLLPDIPDFLITFFALLRLGCVVSPLREQFPARSLREDLDRSGFQGLIISEGHHTYEELSLAYAVTSSLKLASGKVSIWLKGVVESHSSDGCLVDVDPALILWSSGSTGRPRGVVLQHHAVLTNVWANVRALGYQDDDRTLLVLPLSHAYPLVHQCLCHLAIGATVCIPPAPLVGPILSRAIEDFSITNLTTVPPLLRILVEGVRRGRRSHSGLRLVTVGAGQADPSVVREFLRLLPATQLVITYGLTEASPRVSSCFVKGESLDSECVGTPLPNIEVRTSSDEGTGQQILLRGRSLMRSYADDPWVEGADHTLSTSDLGELKNGKWYFRGRLGRTINRGGVIVAAEQIESILLEHPAVMWAHVERKEHSFWGEVPVANVCLHPHSEHVSVGELDRFCAERLPSFGRPFQIQVCSTPVVLPKEKQMLALFQQES